MRSLFTKVRRLARDPDLAIDLGTANTRIYASGIGIVAEEPSLVPIHSEKVEAIAHHAFLLPTHGMVAPLRAGVVVDTDAATLLLKSLFQRVRRFGLMRPRILTCAPTDTSEKERNAIAEAAHRAGGAEVAIIPEPWAAAIGAGLDVTSPYAQMLVDIGDGVTDIAILRDGRIIKTAAIRKGCSDLKAALRDMVLEQYAVWLPSREVERLTQDVDAIHHPIPRVITVVTGLHLKTKRTTRLKIHRLEVIVVMEPIVRKILCAIQTTLRKLPPEIACEVFESGICLTGGGSCIRGMDWLIANSTRLEVRTPKDPLRSVINGAIQTLQYGAQSESWWRQVAWPLSPATQTALDF